MDAKHYKAMADASAVYDVAVRTPLEPAAPLSQRLGNTVLMKREDLQPVFSFKLRGAYNKLASLPAEDRARGVICSSAGNHAQGVALAARELGINATIVMPVTTPDIKVDAVRALDGKVVLHGDAYDDAYEHARRLEAQDDLTFVHPFDDPLVIAGQATIGAEILEQCDVPIDTVFVPVGGGGLIAGIASYLKAEHPDTRVIGVEPVDSASMAASLDAGRPVELDHVGIFADGVAVRRVGDETFRLCQAYVDDIVTVTTDQVCAAIRDIFECTRSIVEPAGGLAVAGLKKTVADEALQGKVLITINCGANVNFDRLRHIAERAAVGEQREMLIAVEIPERPGSFRQFCEAVGKRSITEFNYRYADVDAARIFVGIELKHGGSERQQILAGLREDGYRLEDLSDNEMAKLHVRHMVGGRAPELTDEHLFRFEFPERPGALLQFLDAVGERWNISLFHYRNHGSDHGRVLVGIQVPDAETGDLESHLEKLGYPHWDETDNPAYRAFLG
ncbi:MAG: threonine ammonia-lyase, biosynthetic [Pseudomonadota bacterium]